MGGGVGVFEEGAGAGSVVGVGGGWVGEVLELGFGGVEPVLDLLLGFVHGVASWLGVVAVFAGYLADAFGGLAVEPSFYAAHVAVACFFEAGV